MDKRVEIEGCEVNFLPLPVEETFFRALRHAEFDIAELSLSSYMLLTSRGESPYVAIPAFVSRAFRHSAIYVRTDKGIKEPKDLVGRVVGTPEYQVTAGIWVRGILEDVYGVKPSDIKWRTGGVEKPGRHEKVALTIPNVEITPIPADETLTQWFLDGRIDALIAPRAPEIFARGNPLIARMFPDVQAVEADYYAKTGIFPIMHVVGIRKTLVAQHPWLPASAMKAFTEAKAIAEAEFAQVAALKLTLPWVTQEWQRTIKLMGKDYWPYGVQGNEKTLEAITRYHHGQGLSPRRLSLEELFAPTSLESFRI
jgi:4,5-dihydroxyphthalate decarboxylase